MVEDKEEDKVVEVEEGWLGDKVFFLGGLVEVASEASKKQKNKVT